MRFHRRWATLIALLAALVLVAAACSSDDSSDSSDSNSSETTAEDAAGGSLVGVFGIDAGECADAGVTGGSYFRMVQSGGTLEAGPFIDNADSTCGDTTWTALSPGTDGGLITGDYQPQPDPAFDDAGNGLAAAIIEPPIFFAVGFALATNPTDPQTETDTPAPELSADDSGVLSGDLSAAGVDWNGQSFNQGAPKPDGSTSDGTTAPVGTYDPDTGAYTLEWTSTIAGGAFDGFTGVWHLEGTFTAN